MLSFWSRFKNGVLQNLTATYFRGLFAKDCRCCVTSRSFASTTRCFWPVSRNTWVTGGVCLLMVPGKAEFVHTQNARLMNLNNYNQSDCCKYSKRN